MEICECQDRAEYLKKLDTLRKAGHHIQSIYCYWYEGKGERRTKILPGDHAKKFWKTLSLDQQAKVTFAVFSPEQFPKDIQELAKQYNECLDKDYERDGGYEETTGKPEDAIIAIEYE